MESGSNLFRIMFLVSLVLHAMVFLPAPNFEKKTKKPEQQLFLNYLALKIPSEKSLLKLENKKSDKLRPALETQKTAKKNYKKLKNKKQDLYTRTLKTIRNINAAGEKRIELKNQKLSNVDAPEIKDADKKKSYISYYKLINQQLQESVIYPEVFTEGEVALSFVLTRDGHLHHVEVTQDTSLDNITLRETAMDIVKNASPFPPFPKNLQQQQLTFNVVFCFRERS